MLHRKGNTCPCFALVHMIGQGDYIRCPFLAQNTVLALGVREPGAVRETVRFERLNVGGEKRPGELLDKNITFF